MGSDLDCTDGLSAILDFNPRSRVGATLCYNSIERRRDISIHAPAWGATITKEADENVRDISIHAPAWGATAKMHKFYAFLDKITIFRELNGDFAWF